MFSYYFRIWHCLNIPPYKAKTLVILYAKVSCKSECKQALVLDMDARDPDENIWWIFVEIEFEDSDSDDSDSDDSSSDSDDSESEGTSGGGH